MREIIIIKTDNSEKLKSVLNDKKINYSIIYDDILINEDFPEEEIYRRDMRLANQDQERQREIRLWDKVQNQDNTKLKENDDDWNWN